MTLAPAVLSFYLCTGSKTDRQALMCQKYRFCNLFSSYISLNSGVYIKPQIFKMKMNKTLKTKEIFFGMIRSWDPKTFSKYIIKSLSGMFNKYIDKTFFSVRKNKLGEWKCSFEKVENIGPWRQCSAEVYYMTVILKQGMHAKSLKKKKKRTTSTLYA